MRYRSILEPRENRRQGRAEVKSAGTSSRMVGDDAVLLICDERKEREV